MVQAPLVRVDLLTTPRFNARPAVLTPREQEAWQKFKSKGHGKWFKASTSRHSCGFFFVPKKGTTDLRFVINFAPLNDIIKPRVYAPRADSELRQSISRAKWYSKIDLRDAFYNIGIEPNDTWKLAFRTPDGLMEMTVLPQGLSISPGEFQMYLEQVLAGLIGKEVTVHIDDILVYAMTKERCADLTRAVLARLRTHQLAVSEEKSHFLVPEVVHCGYEYGSGKFRPENRDDSIRNWPTPPNKKDLQGFLGLGNVFHGHVPRYASIAKPLYELTGNNDFHWSPRHEAAFQAMKIALCKALTLYSHEPTWSCTFTTDASLFGICVIITQRGKVTAVWSRTLSNSERNYTADKRELMAVYEGFIRYQYLIELAPAIKVRTDNMINATNLNPTSKDRQRNRWVETLTKYHVIWEHLPGIRNPADGPSRRSDYAKLRR